MLTLQDLTYIHTDKEVLFNNINLTLNTFDKVALIGNNGSGKSTLLKIMAGELHPVHGNVSADVVPYYVPQIVGQYNHLTVTQALRIETKLHALKEILDGNVSEQNLVILDDDWTIEERCHQALAHWQLTNVSLTQKLDTLSGGQKTRVFLAGITLHSPSFVLLDEPSNHLDAASRTVLYNFIKTTSSTVMVVSHDRALVNLVNQIFELSTHGITVYGGNFDFYKEQKNIESQALQHDLKSKEKALRKAKEKERETLERQHKLDARGKKKQEKAGIATIMMNTLRNNAEKSTSKIKSVHAEKIGDISRELNQLRKELPDVDKMKFGFDNALLHAGKILITAKNINVQYRHTWLWQDARSFQITSGERIALKGLNGSGKTTLIKILLGTLTPHQGSIFSAIKNAVYIDQDYSLIDNRLNVYEQAVYFNATALQEHKIKIRLNRFLFAKDDWDKPCRALSGGERMRLMLCCLTIQQQAPDMIVLDEPTNNLDIQNVEILTAAINEYRGTLIVVSHDELFLEQVGINHTIQLN